MIDEAIQYRLDAARESLRGLPVTDRKRLADLLRAAVLSAAED